LGEVLSPDDHLFLVTRHVIYEINAVNFEVFATHF